MNYGIQTEMLISTKGTAKQASNLEQAQSKSVVLKQQKGCNMGKSKIHRKIFRDFLMLQFLASFYFSMAKMLNIFNFLPTNFNRHFLCTVVLEFDIM